MGWRFVSWWRSEIQQPEAFIQSCFFFFWSVSQAHCFHTSRITLKFPEGKSKHGQFSSWSNSPFHEWRGIRPKWLQYMTSTFFGRNIRVGPYSKTNATMQWYNIDVPCLQMFNRLTSIFIHPGLGSWIGFEDSRWIWRSGSVARKAMALQLLEADSKVGSLTVWKFGVAKIWWRTKIWGRSMEI